MSGQLASSVLSCMAAFIMNTEQQMFQLVMVRPAAKSVHPTEGRSKSDSGKSTLRCLRVNSTSKENVDCGVPTKCLACTQTSLSITASSSRCSACPYAESNPAYACNAGDDGPSSARVTIP